MSIKKNDKKRMRVKRHALHAEKLSCQSQKTKRECESKGMRFTLKNYHVNPKRQEVNASQMGMLLTVKFAIVKKI
jgi:hypothetical protein